MTQKTNILENKQKALGIILAIIFSFVLIIILLPKKYNYEYFIKQFEKKTGIELINQGPFNLSFFPRINFQQQDVEIQKNMNDLSINAEISKINIVRSYFDWKNTKFEIESPSIILNGISMRENKINGLYYESKILINNFFSKINEGELSFDGFFDINADKEIDINGSFKNISLTTILTQSKKINWDRLNIKIRSNFYLSSRGQNELELLKNLNANIPIEGLFYINATQEERFGSALLNVLTDKIPEISGISKSLDFLLTNYADLPSKIEGLILIENGIVKSEELLIINDNAKMKAEFEYDIIKDIINGNLYFLQEDVIILKANLEGSIEDPKILIGGKNFITNNNQEPLNDIKKIIEDGITEIFQNLLENAN